MEEIKEKFNANFGGKKGIFLFQIVSVRAGFKIKFLGNGN